MKKLKVAQIITSAKNWAGMEQYAYYLSNGLIREGHEVFFIIANDGDVVQPRFRELGTVYELPLKSKFDFKSAKAIRKIIEKEQPDIIHTHQPKNILNAYWGRGKHKDIKIVHTLHFFIKRSSPKLLYSWIFNRATHIVAISHAVGKHFSEVYPDIPLGKIEIIYNSIDTRHFNTTEIDNTNNRSSKENPVVLGFAGRLDKEKGVDVLLKALAILKDEGLPFSLKIAGTGATGYVKELKELSYTLGIDKNVEFLGFVREMNHFINSFDIGIVPSVFKEPFGLVITEFMSQGKPVITTNNGSQKEIITSEVEGLLVDPCDSQMLANAIKMLIQNPDLRTRMGEAAKQKFENVFAFSIFMRKMIDLYTRPSSSTL